MEHRYKDKQFRRRKKYFSSSSFAKRWWTGSSSYVKIGTTERTENIIEKMEGEFKYKSRGELKNMEKGIVEVKGFALHIDEDKIPKDVSNGMCIQFEVSRIDIW